MSSDLAASHALLTSLPTPRILALCGAGLPASSGLPTFRGAGGLWRRHDATHLATPEAFAADPAIGRGALPSCPRCSSLLRPGVVWFGEALDDALLDSVDGWVEAGTVDAVLVVGTSARVVPAAAYAERGRARRARVCVVHVEVGRDRREGVDFVLEGDAAVLLPRMLEPLIGALEE
ncbi:hypothetical protein BN1708_003393, partial [Verticillium longisporum]